MPIETGTSTLTRHDPSPAGPGDLSHGPEADPASHARLLPRFLGPPAIRFRFPLVASLLGPGEAFVTHFGLTVGSAPWNSGARQGKRMGKPRPENVGFAQNGTAGQRWGVWAHFPFPKAPSWDSESHRQLIGQPGRSESKMWCLNLSP